MARATEQICLVALVLVDQFRTPRIARKGGILKGGYVGGPQSQGLCGEKEEKRERAQFSMPQLWETELSGLFNDASRGS